MLQVAIRRAVGDFRLDVALEASSGVTAVFGPSGAGKTTLARCIAGLERPDSGRIVLEGEKLFGDGTNLPPHRRRIGYVFQEARLFPHMTVHQNLIYGAPRGVRPDAIAEMLGIAPLLGRRPAGLSGGEAARVSLGRALLRAPRLLILDEPLASLDYRRRAAILPYLERVRDAGTPILYISHAIEEVARLASTLVLLRGGQVARAGPAGALLSDPDVATMLGPDQAGAMLEGVLLSATDGLARVRTPVGVLELAGLTASEGAAVRLRVRAEDVMIATVRPEGLSARNIFQATVETIREGQGPGVMIGLRAGDGQLLARLTRSSSRELGLAPGLTVWAVLKTSAVARMDVGG